MGTLHTYPAIDQSTKVHVVATRIAHQVMTLVTAKFGKQVKLPKGKSDTIIFTRVLPLPVATTALTEGVTPSPSTLVYERVSVPLKEYGAIATFSNLIESFAEDPVVDDLVAALGEQVGATTEQLTLATLVAGTNVFYAATADTLRTDVNDRVSYTALELIGRSFKNNHAKKVRKQIDASGNVATNPVAASFICFMHSNIESDLKIITGFVPVENYSAQMDVMPDEIGKIGKFRFISTADMPYWANAGSATLNGMLSDGGVNTNVYPMIFCGEDAFGIVNLAGASDVSMTIISAGEKTKEDPLGQRGVVGWKTFFAALRYNEAWIGRLEVSATAVPTGS